MPIIRPTLLLVEEYYRKAAAVRAALIRDSLDTAIDDFDTAVKLLMKVRQAVKLAKGNSEAVRNYGVVNSNSGNEARTPSLAELKSQYYPNVAAKKQAMFSEVGSCRTQVELDKVQVKWNLSDSLLQKVILGLPPRLPVHKIKHIPSVEYTPDTEQEENDDNLSATTDLDPELMEMLNSKK